MIDILQGFFTVFLSYWLSALIVGIPVMLFVIFIALAAAKIFKLSKAASKTLNFFLVFVLLALIWGGIRLYTYHFRYGRIKALYVINTKSGPRLTTLSFVTLRLRMGNIYYSRLTTFDLFSGKVLGYVHTGKSSEYTIYHPFGQKAWGHSYPTGVQLLDLATPKVLAGKKDILAKNPKLGGDFRLASSIHFYDPKTHSVQVVTSTGQYFRIGSDLSAAPINNYVRRSASAGGRLINQSVLSDREKEKVIATLFFKGEKFVFLSRGGYTLSALRKDPATGKTLKRIDYVK